MLGSKASVVAASIFLASLSTAILVAPGSPCVPSCGNVLNAITGPDVVCDESQYSYSPAGIVFETCTNCELTSTYSSDNQTDLQWMLCEQRTLASQHRVEGTSTSTSLANTLRKRQCPIRLLLLYFWAAGKSQLCR